MKRSCYEDCISEVVRIVLRILEYRYFAKGSTTETVSKRLYQGELVTTTLCERDTVFKEVVFRILNARYCIGDCVKHTVLGQTVFWRLCRAYCAEAGVL